MKGRGVASDATFREKREDTRPALQLSGSSADIDCDHRTVRIARQLCEVAGRPLFLAPPKSDASKRTVSMPSMIVADVSVHLDAFTIPEAEALVFSSPHGKPLRHPNFRRGVWYPALAATGLDVDLHDLRHTGNQLVAEAGANPP